MSQRNKFSPGLWVGGRTTWLVLWIAGAMEYGPNNQTIFFILLALLNFILLEFPVEAQRGKSLNPFAAKRVDRKGAPLCTANRAGGLELPENTVAAARYAAGAGASISVDAVLTADHQVVLCYPGTETLARIAGLAAPITELNLEDLPQLKSEMPPAPELFYVTKEPRKVARLTDADSTQIGTLETLFKDLPKDCIVTVNLHEKSPARKKILVQQVCGLVAKHKRQKTTILGHPSDRSILGLVLKEMPEACTIMPNSISLRVYLFFYGGIIALLPLSWVVGGPSPVEGIHWSQRSVFRAPIVNIGLYRKHTLKDSSFPLAWELLYWVLGKLTFTPALFENLHDRGVLTQVSANVKSDWQEIKDCGQCAVVQTDYPLRYEHWAVGTVGQVGDQKGSPSKKND